jgi:hypothetical protein
MKHEIHSISDTKGRHCGALLYTRQGLDWLLRGW